MGDLRSLYWKSLFTISWLLLTGCIQATPIATPRGPTPAEPLVSTETVIPTSTPALENTRTPEEQPTPSPEFLPSTTPCLDLPETPPPPAAGGLLRIVFKSDPAPIAASILGSIQIDIDSTTLRVWKEETQTAEPVSLPAGVADPRFSSDYQLVHFLKVVSDQEAEFWVVDNQGNHPRRLIDTSTLFNVDGLSQIEGVEYSLTYNWLPGSHLLAYHLIEQAVGGVAGQLATSVFVDADAGQVTWSIPPGRGFLLGYSPDGGQVAVLDLDPTSSAPLQLIRAQDGRIQFTLPTSMRSFGPVGSSSPVYSPDGKYAVGFSDDGVVRVNAENGQWQVIPLPYTAISSPGDSVYYLSPKITWIEADSFLMPVSNAGQEGEVIELFELATDPTATFTVWQIDLSQAEAQPVNTFTGDVVSVLLSPDGSRLAFRMVPEGGGEPVLQIADLKSGQVFHKVGENTCCLEWGPDSARFLYIEGQDFPYEGTGSVYLGEVCKEPVLIADVDASVEWIDANRFLLLVDPPQLLTLSIDGISAMTVWPDPSAYDYHFYFGDD